MVAGALVSFPAGWKTSLGQTTNPDEADSASELPGMFVSLILWKEANRSFLGMGKSINSMCSASEREPAPGPVPIAWMSFQLAIPWQVALQQCPPPLRQLRLSLKPAKFFRQGS